MPADEMTIELTVNSRRQAVQVAVHHTLLDVLRDRIGLTGSKECCAEGECGACTIIVDGRGVNSCLMLAVEADGSEVQTIEGLAVGDRLSPIQEAFLEHGAVQCGFCIPGMVMSAQALLSANPNPSREEIREGLSGNLCRCGGYNQICHAVAAAAEVSET
jgi:carbon-monoxide dehydrogenase small subunit